MEDSIRTVTLNVSHALEEALDYVVANPRFGSTAYRRNDDHTDKLAIFTCFRLDKDDDLKSRLRECVLALRGCGADPNTFHLVGAKTDEKGVMVSLVASGRYTSAAAGLKGRSWGNWYEGDDDGPDAREAVQKNAPVVLNFKELYGKSSPGGGH